jgi:hypothetical protein
MQPLVAMSSVLRNLEQDVRGGSAAAALDADDWAAARLREFCERWHAEPTQGRFDADALLGEPIHRFLLELSAVPLWTRAWAAPLLADVPRCLALLELAEQLDVVGLADALGVLLREQASADPHAFCARAGLAYDLPSQAQNL